MVFDDHEIGENRLLRPKPVIQTGEEPSNVSVFDPRILFEGSRGSLCQKRLCGRYVHHQDQHFAAGVFPGE
jgi:hypothetical protein